MKLNHLARFTIAALALAGSAPALACTAAGSSVHIGPVTSIDAAAHTFTIRDAQTGGPITFSGAPYVIEAVKGARGPVMVNYKDSANGGLEATDVRF